MIRRLSFDLLGLPPTPDEVEAFVLDDRDDAYERLVDRLLASPQYGVRWARLWLDLARYGESNGFEHDEFRPDSWPYRDWVVNALNRDMPYDRFARLQLAGDVLEPDNPEAIEATGFLVAGAYDSVGQTQQSEAMRRVVRQDEMEDIISTVGQTFLGLTIHCARCHDHKFDPIRQVDYYRFSAALAGVRHGVRDLTTLDPDVLEDTRRIENHNAELANLERPIREQIRAERGAKTPITEPIARWDFRQDTRDRIGSLHGTLQGSAQMTSEGLNVDGKTGYVATAPLAMDLTAKTLEAWVQLGTLQQRGGGVMSIQSLSGNIFDSIVFGEREPGRWMAGSESFLRTRSLEGSEENEADQRPVHLAIVYDSNGTITAYRDGRLYGTSYTSKGPVTYHAGDAQIVFGMRHAPNGGNKMLDGRIVFARLYDRALTAAELATSAANFISNEEIQTRLTSEQRTERERLIAERDALRARRSMRTRKVYAVSPRPPEVVHRLNRGNPDQPMEVVSPGGLSALADLNVDFGLPPDSPEGERRVRLAAWITDHRNPLFARVIVNRIWQTHFGEGLVETPSDLGFHSGVPSHPELLDWLASDLISQGWSLKQLHRRIVTSATYRQSSAPDPSALQIDANNRLLWRKAPLRLEAEMVRDSMLAISGNLNPWMGGPGFREFEVSRAEGTTTNRYTPVVAVGSEFDRRTLYRTWARGGRSGFLDAFDCPDPSTTSPRRAVTTTPIQALALLNNTQSLREVERFASRLRREVGNDPGLQVERAYWLAFGRQPDPEEREEARRVVESFGPAVLARAIFNSNEFLYVD